MIFKFEVLSSQLTKALTEDGLDEVKKQNEKWCKMMKNLDDYEVTHCKTIALPKTIFYVVECHGAFSPDLFNVKWNVFLGT